MRTTVLSILLLLQFCGFAQDLSPWTTSFVVSAGGYSDTIWIGCDTAGDLGYQESLDILDTGVFSGPLKIIGYDSVVQETFNTTTCGNLRKNIKSFDESFLKPVSTDGHYKNAYKVKFYNYVFVDTSIINLDTNNYGDVDSLWVFWDSTDFKFKNDSFEITWAVITQTNGFVRTGPDSGFNLGQYICQNFESTAEAKLFPGQTWLQPQEYMSECYSEYNKFDLISGFYVSIQFNYQDTTTLIKGIQKGLDPIGSLYPNPCINTFDISLNNSLYGQIVVLNLSGETVITKKVNGEKFVRFDMHKNPNGIYIVKLLDKHNAMIGIKKLIVQR